MSARELCFYCRKPVIKDRLEQDHAPIPKRHGGTETVPACIACHDLKDRLPFRSEDWTVELMVQAFDECGPLGRIFLAKAFGASMDRREVRHPLAAP